MAFFQLHLAFIEGLGGSEMVMILMIVLVLFGGEKLPGFARGLGKSIREFKKAASGVEEEFKRALEEDEKKLAPPPTTFPPYPPALGYTEPSAPETAAEPAIDPHLPPMPEAQESPSEIDPHLPPPDTLTPPPVTETPLPPPLEPGPEPSVAKESPPTKPTPPATAGDHLP